MCSRAESATVKPGRCTAGCGTCSRNHRYMYCMYVCVCILLHAPTLLLRIRLLSLAAWLNSTLERPSATMLAGRKQDIRTRLRRIQIGIHVRVLLRYGILYLDVLKHAFEIFVQEHTHIHTYVPCIHTFNDRSNELSAQLVRRRRPWASSKGWKRTARRRSPSSRRRSADSLRSPSRFARTSRSG